jgi:hypothetical protein
MSREDNAAVLPINFNRKGARFVEAGALDRSRRN